MNSTQNSTVSIEDDIAAVLEAGVLVCSFQRACDALRDPRLEPAHRHVLADLLESMNSSTASTWLSRERLAEKARVRVKTVKNALYELRNFGYVDWFRKPPTPAARRAILHYTIPAARVDRKSLQDEIAKFVAEKRSSSAGPASAPDDITRHSPTNAPSAGHAPVLGHTPGAGLPNAPMVGQQELTKELTKKIDLPTEVVGAAFDAYQASKGRKPYSEQFEEFWKAFPVKDGKWAAFDKSWRKLDAGSRAQAVTAAPLYAARVIAEKIEKPKWAQGWLTERRFEDELRRSAPAAAEQIWWEDPNKVAAITDGQWRGSITKHANGIWPIDKLGPPPGNHRCVVPRHLIAELKLEEKYTSAGISRGVRR